MNVIGSLLKHMQTQTRVLLNCLSVQQRPLPKAPHSLSGPMCVLVLVFGLSATAQAAAKPVSCFKTHSIFAKRSARGKAVYAAAQAKTPNETKTHKRATPIEVTDADTFAEAMTKGMHLRPTQGDLFGIYMAMYFGNPKTELDGNSFSTVMQILKEHPNLEKSHFPEYEINKVVKVYESPKELDHYIQTQISTAGQFRSNLFQIEANLIFWKKLLSFEEPQQPEVLKHPPGKDSSTSEKEAYKVIRDNYRQKQARSQKRFMSYLDRIISKENRDLLKSDSINYEQKIEVLFRTLELLAKHLEKNKRDSRPLRQAMVDLVHSTGYNNPANAALLKNSDAIQRFEGLRKILEERDTMAMKLGFEGHFTELLEKLGIDYPTLTGITEAARAQKILLLQQETLKGKYSTKPIDTIRVRSLSIQEAGFRSCLGGSDCSSRTYFSKAFDPNYHYFTMTDRNHKSSGHLTVVLGQAKHPKTGKLEKVAFADKLQNVPDYLIPEFLHSVSLSLAKKGYKLAIPERLELPEEVSYHAGLSNTPTIMQFVQDHILNKLQTKLVEFTPHPHQYQFENAYSRADNRLSVRLYEPLFAPTGETEIRAGLVYKPYLTSSTLNKDHLIAKFLSLRESQNPEDILRYVTSIRTVKLLAEQKLFSPQIFYEDLLKFIAQPNRSYNIRKTAWLEYSQNSLNREQALHHFHFFSDAERETLANEIRAWSQSTNQEKAKFASQFLTDFAAKVFDFAENEAQVHNLHLLFRWQLSAVEVRNKNGESLFQHAVRAGNLKGAQYLASLPKMEINNGFLSQIANEYVNSKSNKALASIKILLQIPGVDLNLQRHDEARVVYGLATQTGNSDLMERLVKSQIYFQDPKPSDQQHRKNDMIYLKLAIASGQVEFVQRMLNQYEPTKSFFRGFLFTAIEFNQKRAFEMLMQLPYATVSKEHVVKAIEIRDEFYLDGLLQKPIPDINSELNNNFDKYRNTVLKLSSQFASPTLLKKLLQIPGIDINNQASINDGKSFSVLHSYFYQLRLSYNTAKEKDNLIECLEILLAHPGLKLTELDMFGKERHLQASSFDGSATPLIHALSTGNEKLIRKTIELVIPAGQDRVSEILLEIVSWLDMIATSSQPLHRDRYEYMRLENLNQMRIAILNYVRVLLKDPSLDLRALNSSNGFPVSILLHRVANHNHFDLARILVSKMTQEGLNVLDGNGKTALDYAYSYQRSYLNQNKGRPNDMINLLYSAGARTASMAGK